jgi:hypothetical protein
MIFGLTLESFLSLRDLLNVGMKSYAGALNISSISEDSYFEKNGNRVY